MRRMKVIVGVSSLKIKSPVQMTLVSTKGSTRPSALLHCAPDKLVPFSNATVSHTHAMHASLLTSPQLRRRDSSVSLYDSYPSHAGCQHLHRHACISSARPCMHASSMDNSSAMHAEASSYDDYDKIIGSI